MHNPLEEYLDQLSEHLTPMPVERRNEELKEMRQHLLNSVIVNQEFGQSETEAATNAIEQFGLPQELAGSIINSWQRGIILDRRSLWGAFLCAFSLSLLIYPLLTNITHTFFIHSSNPNIKDVIAISTRFIAGILIGSLTGLILPKRAVTAVLLNNLIGVAIGPGQFILRWCHGDINAAQPFSTLLALSEIVIDSSITTILAAWAASRWRNREGRQRNIAAMSCQ